MSPVSPEGTRFDSASDFARNWAQRLRDIGPLDTLRNNPIMGADRREIPQIEDSLGKLKEYFEQSGPSASFDPKAIKAGNELGSAFLRRQKYLQDLSGGAVRPLSERLADFAQRSGADVQNLNTQDFGGLLHETISHDLPYQSGFSPDYTKKQIRGYRIPASSISPLNESLATEIDRSGNFGTKVNARSAFLDPHNPRLENFYNAQGDYAASMRDVNRPSYTNRELKTNPKFAENLNTFQRESIRSNPFYEIRNRLLKGRGTEGDARVQLDLEEANRLFDWKFTKPLTERWENLAQVQAPSSISKDFLPSWSNTESLLYGYPGKEGLILRGFDPKITGRNKLLNLGQNLAQYVPDPNVTRFGGGNQMLFSLDPLTTAAQGIPEAARTIRRNRTGAALGLTGAILNPEVARAVERDDYRRAGTIVARDVALGTAAEAGLRAAAPTIASRLPAVATALAPVTRFANPVLTGVALLAEGRSGSLTDVITRKAGEHPISWLPSAKPDPRTDLGARASRALISIPYKTRQFLGTESRSGILSPELEKQTREIARTRPADFIPSIRAQTPQESRNMQALLNENWWQRRQRLAEQRRNPAKLEFGISEWLFGR